MGCGASKVDDFQLVTLCRERKEFIKAASHHRYALAAAHVSYFQSLTQVGDALRKFLDEVIVAAAAGSSSPASPILTLPSDQGKRRTPKPRAVDKTSLPSPALSHSASFSPRNSQPDQIDGSHLHFSSGSDSDSDLGSSSKSNHIHLEDSPEEQKLPTPPPYSTLHSPPFWGPPLTNVQTYYMRRSPTPAKTMVYDGQERYFAPNGQWTGSSFGYQGYSQYQNTGFYGMPMGMHSSDYFNHQASSPAPPPPAPPSPPSVSAWDYINIFDSYDYGYPGYYPESKYGYGSTVSSPDSSEVRKREGIPDLEDETEQEQLKATYVEKKVNLATKNKHKKLGEGTSKAVPPQSYSYGGKSKTVPLQTSDSSMSSQRKERYSSPDTIETRSSVDELVRKKAVSFEVGEGSALDAESSKLSSITTLTARGTRDLPEVVKEIRDEFEAASSYGKEVALLLEAGKLPYQSKTTILKAFFSRIMYLMVPSMLYSHPPPGTRLQLDTRTVKLAKQYNTSVDHDFVIKSGNLSLTLDKLCAWEKKLYKEVKDEEKLRLMYEKKCKRLKTLDERGADSSKIDATQIAIRKLLTKINVCLSAVAALSGRIHKLRDEELQPQLTELIRGLMKMWKSTFKCHQKQFEAIMDSKIRSLKPRSAFRGDLSMKVTLQLELELRNWYKCFNSWISSQKCYVEALNEWLLRCISHEGEASWDGTARFSPGRMGAPPVFITCNDWQEGMERISGERVGKAMREFASKLEHLWGRQGEEQRQRIKAEFASKDWEKLRRERGRMKEEQERTRGERKGVWALDDLKVDLDEMRKRVEEERERHKDAMRLVHSAAWSSVQVGLVPIFEALDKFSRQALKAHEQVRMPVKW